MRTLYACLLAATVATGAISLVCVPHAEAAPPPSKAGMQARKPDFTTGARIFKEAVAYLRGSTQTIHQIKNFYAELDRVKLDWEGGKHAGFMRVWFAMPDKYRFEIRPGPSPANRTTKILNGERGWIMDPNGRISQLQGTADGVRAIAQLRRDRDRMKELSQFLTLETLSGPGVKFDYEGKTVGGGHFAGKWLKVNRIVGNVARLVFWFAYEEMPNGSVKRATYPGVVTIVGDPTKREPTEWYVLQNWKAKPGGRFRYPTKIQAFTVATQGAQPERFLLAFPRDIRINAAMTEREFTPPRPRGR